MPGLNNCENRQVVHDSQGLRVTVCFTDDSTSEPINNAADDLTLVSTNNDVLTSTINSDDLTSASPSVVPIGRGERLARPNNVSNPSPTGRGVGRGGRVLPSSRNASNNLFVGRGVGRGQPIKTNNTQPSTSAPRVGREVGHGAGRTVLAGVEDIFILTGVRQTKLQPLQETKLVQVLLSFWTAMGKKWKRRRRVLLGRMTTTTVLLAFNILLIEED